MKHQILFETLLQYFDLKSIAQSNLYKMTTFWITQKWLSWAVGSLLKDLYKMTTNQMWTILAYF